MRPSLYTTFESYFTVSPGLSRILQYPVGPTHLRRSGTKEKEYEVWRSKVFVRQLHWFEGPGLSRLDVKLGGGGKESLPGSRTFSLN